MAGLTPLALPRRGAHSGVGEFGLAHDRFKLVRALSNGGQGQVCVCERLSSGELFAVKIIDRQALQTSQRNEVLLRREIRTLRELQHPNVVSLHDAFWERGSCFIVMDLAQEGDLREKVALHVGLGEDAAGSEHASRYVARQLVGGINYMHERRVIHRDLKVDNILVAGSRPAAAPLLCKLYEVQITDFGLSTWLDIVGEEMTPCGTPNYLAPEVLREMYDERVDFWSFGVVLYILLCGDFPFNTASPFHNPADVSRLESMQIKETPTWQAVSDTAKDFVCGLLSVDPETRLTHGACLRHAWLGREAASSGWLTEAELCEPTAPAAEPIALQRAGCVATVSGWIGAAVDSLKCTHRDGSVQSHGGEGGWAMLRYTLEPDETIIAIAQETRNGLSEHLGNAIALYTSACNVFEFQGSDARRRRRFVAPVGCQIVGLQFVSSRLTGIHIEGVPDDGVKGAVGQISGRVGYAVDQATLHLRSGASRVYGSAGGFEEGPWQLEPNEYITVVEQARREAYLGNSLAFYTSAGKVYKLSGMEASVSRRFAAPPGMQICGADFEASLLAGVKICAQHISHPQAGDIQDINLELT